MARKRTKRRPWTDAELYRVVEFYPEIPTHELAKVLGRSCSAVYWAAYGLGLRKSQAFCASPASGRTTGRQGIGTRFPKGHRPWNKGMKGFDAGGRSKETRFKKGHRPQTWRPVGSYRYSHGYLQQKITDTGYPPRDWKAVHVLLWEKHHGPVPDGHVVIFKNGRKDDIRIENLELLTRGENMRRNSFWNNYPPELAKVIQLRGALNRQINQREAPP